MSTDAWAVAEAVVPAGKREGPTLVALLPASVAAFVWPRCSAVWGKATMGRALVVAGINTVCGFLWAYAILVMATVWLAPGTKADAWHSPWVAASYHSAAALLGEQWNQQWKMAGLLDTAACVLIVALCILLAYVVPFLMLLPFAARAGRNRACMRFVLRIVLQGSGLVHWWGAAFAVGIFVYAAWRVPSMMEHYAQAVSPLLLLFSALALWHMAVLIHAARREYRKAADMPAPHDPWCDVCGYNLTGIGVAGRCPECGKPIEESLGEAVRPPTPWELRPSPFNGAAIARQLGALVRHPRRLFYSMPTLSGQRAAQRWLLGSLAVIFLFASAIVPAIFLVMDAEWNSVVLTGTLAMSLAWTGFALMMVGVETAGIATFSRMRGHPGGGVYLAAAAKVTCYTSILMVVWVVLGGAQLVTYTYFSTVHDIFKMHAISLRWHQIILGSSLAITHIGGLLWYELTVYRGVRAIQYASK